ncbi:MAG: RNA-directed DNA polymerase [Planctomycetales bacterium]|nr:RNA-directed DNA polymerase [Planctomycetales bacterium]
MATHRHIAKVIAGTAAAGQLTEDEIVARVAGVLGKRWRWLRPLARRMEERFAGRTRPRESAVHRWIIADDGFHRACRQHAIVIVEELPHRPEMRPPTGIAMTWNVPTITTVYDLAHWADLPLDELEWLADRRGREPSAEAKYRRYRYRVLSKGQSRFRLIETPIYRLKLLQRHLLSGILDHLSPHDAAHGFRKGRSIHTFADNHLGRQVVLKMDLRDCFTTIDFGRVSHLFRLAGYPERVADTLAAITTNTVPDQVWEAASGAHVFCPSERLPSIYASPHLPQGAPTSPAIANLCLYKLDLRLTGLAKACGASYSRYADDLAFSGDADFARCVQRVRHHIAAIIQEEGFEVNHRKTRVMRASTRQRITGIVVNQHRNIPRREYDQLKAILHNCISRGLQSQNRDKHTDYRAHLAGRVAFVEAVSPSRGQRLRDMLNQIDP